MNKTVIVFILLVLFSLMAMYLMFGYKQKSTLLDTIVSTDNNSAVKEDKTEFLPIKKAAHYESNTPEHGAILAGAPVNVVINFNFDLASGTTLQIVNNGIDYSEGQTAIDSNKLVLRRAMQSTLPDGIYTVIYKACWADGSCHDGQFQFKIDRSQVALFTDMRNKKEVVVELKDFTFKPKQILISRGTKITWRNVDLIEHTVNTDSHPGHTYYLVQNSRTLKSGDTYSVTFDKVGIYPYHCTPHAATMKGMVLVD